MSTRLFAITNSKFIIENYKSHIDLVFRKLKSLNLNPVYYVNSKGITVKETGEWEYHIDDDPFSIEFNSPFAYDATLYSNIGVINSIHNYSLLYEISNLDFFDDFRKSLFEIVTCLGGTEVIFLADNTCNKLAHYLDNMAIENIPYEKIKSAMINELGQPITDYKKLDKSKLNYKKITEFFLDDFKDLKK